MARNIRNTKATSPPAKTGSDDRRQSNADYYDRTRDRIILRESELRPSTVLELIDCLSEVELHPADRRVERLQALYRDLTGSDPSAQE